MANSALAFASIVVGVVCLCTLALAQTPSASFYQELVTLPTGLTNQSGYTYLKQSTMLNIIGTPCPFEADCTSVTNTVLKPLIVTQSVPPLGSVTGMKPAVDALKRAMEAVQAAKPDLAAVLKSAGMLCCRAVRGSTSSYSNHAWGAAIDFTIAGSLDPRGDNSAQRGLLELWPYMKAQGFYWGAGFSGASEDAMHFEISDQVFNQWNTDGTLWGNAPTPVAAPTAIVAPVSPPVAPPVDPKSCAVVPWPIYEYDTPIVYESDVVALQYLLQAAGYNLTVDGYFGQKTANAVDDFQTNADLFPDGVVGKNTWSALAPFAVVQVSGQSAGVKAIQHLLKNRHNMTITIDGVYSESLKGTMSVFQLSHNTPPTGVVSVATFKSLLTDCNNDGTTIPQASSTTQVVSMVFFAVVLVMLVLLAQ